MIAWNPDQPFRILYFSPDHSTGTDALEYLEQEHTEMTVIHEPSPERAKSRLCEEAIDCLVYEVSTIENHEIDSLSFLHQTEPATPMVVITKQSPPAHQPTTFANHTTAFLKYEGDSSQEELKNSIINAVQTHRLQQFNKHTHYDPLVLLESVTNAVMVINDEWRITYVSPTDTTVFNSLPEDLINKIIWEAIPSLKHTAFYDASTKALEHNDPQTIDIEYEPGDAWYRNHIYPSDDGATFVIEDITDQKTRETVLREAKTQLQTAIEAGAIGTWLWKIQSDTLIAGPKLARTFGVDPNKAKEGLPLETFTSSIYENDYERVINEINQSLDECGEYECKYRVYDAERNVRWVVARGHVECDESGTPRTFPGILTDITEQKQYERQLENQNKRLEEFARVVSHDLRNPLQVAKGHLELRREDLPSDHYDTIARALGRMDDMITDLLTLAREGNTAIEIEAVHLAELITDCWTNFNHTTATLTGTVDIMIKADERRLKQLFENLFRNAIEHTHNNVTIRVGELDRGFYIEDNGPGISQEDRDRVFEIGYSTQPGGTGFGLGIVEQAVDAHDWELALTNSESGGARFEITGVTILD